MGRPGVFLFGLVFFGIGAAIGYKLVLPDLQDWQAARRYVPVPARLLGVELERHRGSKSTTYRVRATYRYTYGDREFTGNRVGVSRTADNIGGYHQALYARLSAAQRRGGEVTAWVDPVYPRRALLDREMRWGLFAFKSLLAAMFTLVGGGIAVYAWRVPLRSAVVPFEAMPSQPSGRIVSNSRTAMRTWWIFAVAWNLIASPALFFLPNEIAKGNWPVLLILLFPLVGIWLLYKAVHTTLQWRRFGALVLTLAPYPGAVGGAITGTVQLPERFGAAQLFRVTVTCVRRRTSGSGRNRTATETAMWQDETRGRANASGRGTLLSFGFNVPPGLPASGAPSRDYVLWTVDVDADLPGVDLESRFEVPMISAAAATTAQTSALPERTPDATPDIPANIVRMYHDRGATVFYYPLLRYPAMGVGLLLFSLILGAPAVFMFNQLHGSAMDVVLWLMIAAFGLFGLLLFVVALYTIGNTLRVEISPRGLTTVRRIFGFGFSRHAPLDAIQSVETKIGSQSNSSGKINVRYRLVAHSSDGRSITVGNDIPGRALAEHLARLVGEACGLRNDYC